MFRLPKPFIAAFPVALLGIAIGCQATPAPATARQDDASAPARQLIIKFKAGTVACDAAGIAGFSAASAVRLKFIRPMSGDACVVQQQAEGAGGFARGQAVLQRQSSIEWVEEDTAMKAM